MIAYFKTNGDELFVAVHGPDPIVIRAVLSGTQWVPDRVLTRAAFERRYGPLRRFLEAAEPGEDGGWSAAALAGVISGRVTVED